MVLKTKIWIFMQEIFVICIKTIILGESQRFCLGLDRFFIEKPGGCVGLDRLVGLVIIRIEANSVRLD